MHMTLTWTPQQVPVSKPFRLRMGDTRLATLTLTIVRFWHGQVLLAVVSNGTKGNVIASLRALGLLNLFDTVVPIGDVAAASQVRICIWQPRRP